MVAGSPGQVDLVLYKANTGLNPNIAFYDANANPCTEGDPGCNPNTTVWNTYFGQSQNALNTGPNFKLVQISDHPIHTGGVCTGGPSCDSSPQADREPLGLLTIDVQHTGAEFWAASNPVGDTAIYNNDNFYVAYRDNPPDGTPRVEAGAINSLSPSFTHDEFNPYENGTLGGNCTSALAPSPCTLTMTVSL